MFSGSAFVILVLALFLRKKGGRDIPVGHPSLSLSLDPTITSSATADTYDHENVIAIRIISDLSAPGTQ